ncbi:hypothetical protein Y032_0142g2348 [Ancylostoma ceylanicum]|uniref:Uncharacterized protein n=1 Tax=Ancylostoma ceylanicum TaxID=53326 RepID=A0A016T3Y5_9BILA|nr:hypothetical protein Y032_0142g2348 [Ancylostoma ceylanicum]
MEERIHFAAKAGWGRHCLQRQIVRQLPDYFPKALTVNSIAEPVYAHKTRRHIRERHALLFFAAFIAMNHQSICIYCNVNAVLHCQSISNTLQNLGENTRISGNPMR